MAKKIFLTCITLFAIIAGSSAQTRNEASVAKAVEQLRRAMVDADSVVLDKLTSPQLSYGHSGGHIDNKTEFIQKLVSGRSDFVSMELPDQTIVINKHVAIVRHKLNAATNDSGKPAEVHLLVLLIWQKQHGNWKLLARQAVKVQ